MAHITLVCINRTTGERLASQLKTVIGDQIRIDVLPTESVPLPDRIQADLVLLTSRPLVADISRRVIDSPPIVLTDLTLWRKDWQELMALPPRSRVLIAHETVAVAQTVITLLLELGIRHLELLPYAPGESVPTPIDLIVHSGYPEVVPQIDVRVKCIGPRPLDSLTMLSVMSKLDLLTEESNARLHGWLGETMTRSHGVVGAVTWLGEMTRQIQAVLDISGDAMVACDVSGRVSVFNRRAEELLGMRAAHVVGQPADDTCPELGLDLVLNGRPPSPNTIVEMNGRRLLTTCVPLRRHGHLTGAVAICREATPQQVTGVATVARKGHKARYTFSDVIGQSPAILETVAFARRVTKSESTVLITGETGTGKEVLAQSIHNASPRQSGPFVAANCAALPGTLLESELFGYEEGAFTGAAKGGKRGLFEQAHGGTIFLDEIGDASLSVQARLLRALEERQIMRVGGTAVIPVDLRVIAATNRDLRPMIADGDFRADLYYRLSVLHVALPPLRDRRGDLPLLVRHFLQQFEHLAGVVPEVMAVIMEHDWPGNIRELRNCLEHMTIVSDGERLTPAHLPPYMRQRSSPEQRGQLDHVDTLILQSMGQANQEGRGMGRGQLRLALLEMGVDVTETHVRERMRSLAERGLVRPGRGRGGTRLTEKGLSEITVPPPHQ